FGIEDETERQARQALDASRADQMMGNFNGFLDEWKNKPMFQSTRTDKELNQISSIQKKQNPVWMANSLLGFGTGTMPCIKKELENLICPVQLIVGEQDLKFIRINQSMNKQIPDSSFSIVEGANHRVHFDQPEECSKIIKTFITNYHLL
ncbi:MAG: 2-succinyl-6-hydroxy-2,4-cyclohexadiene-1-carboxylate synthase, partial [Balneola sp.]